MIVTALVFLVILSVLVLIHELGHFLVAKKLGIKVEEFGFGFPPRVFGIKRGETLYSINLLPIGGFVKLFGEDEAGAGKISLPVSRNTKYVIRNTDLERAFFARPVNQRAAVAVAGVVMNALLAIVIFYTFLFISGFKTQLPLIGDYKFFGVNQQNVSDIIINKVAKNSPAEKAGITPISKILTINNIKVPSVTRLVEIIEENKGKEITITFEDINTGKRHSGRAIPRVSPPKNEGALGIQFFPATIAVLSYETPLQKAFSGIIHPINVMVYNFDIMGKLIGISLKEKNIGPLGESVAGPVGIYSIVENIIQIPDAKEKILQILNLSGILSLSLAFFNILPIPALDGGRLFFILMEGISGRKISQKIEGHIHSIGMIILLGLILLVTLKDILKLLP